MANFHAYFAGICIESVSHPKDLAAAKRYFTKRYQKSSENQMVVISGEATQEDIQAAIAKSKLPPSTVPKRR